MKASQFFIIFFRSTNLFRVAINVGLPLLAFRVCKWVSMNWGMLVIVTPAASRIGSVGKVMPAKYVSSS